MKRLFALALAATIAVTGCGGSDDDASPAKTSPQKAGSSAQPGDADVMFAQMMIPHHQQALEMTKLVPSRSASAEVKKLAAAITQAQDPEIKTMTGWLTSWGAPATPAPEHTNHGTGMMTMKEMKRLKTLNGAAFDKAFLTMMIKHHQGAVTMAKDEQASGQHGPAKQMAAAIIKTQNDEIARMRTLRKTG